MLEIRSVRFKNWQAFGNTWTEFDFTVGERTLITGKNGSGKSSIYEIVYFVLYGKSFRKSNKSELVNDINGGDLVGEVRCVRNGTEFLIRRGVAPKIFDIERDGEEVHQKSNDAETQRWLEEHVLQMDPRTFSQIVILGSDSYRPFMQLSAGERRVVGDDVLSMGLYSIMTEYLKKNILPENREAAEQTIRERDALKKEVDEVTAVIDRLSQRAEQRAQRNQEKLEEIRGHIEAEKKKALEIRTSLIEVSTSLAKIDLPKIEKTLKSLYSEKGRIDSRIDVLEANLSDLDGATTCPTCSRPIDDDLKHSLLSDKEELERQATNRESVLSRIDSAEKIVSFHRKLTNTKSSLESQARTILANIASRQAQEKSLLNELDHETETSSSDIEEYETQLAQALEEIDSRETELKAIQFDIEDYDEILKILSDKGVKRKIISQYLPVINETIQKYLDIMEFPFRFSFDDQWKETIEKKVGLEKSYASLSTGQKLRIDLAIMFAWRHITRLRSSSSCNLLVLDEIGSSSLDAEGVDAFMKIIQIEKESQSVIIISHRPDAILSRVDNVLEVGINSGFSEIRTIDKTELGSISLL